MRFGLVGTGHWARVTHAAALRDVDGVDLAGVWGRDPVKAAALADEVGARAFDDVDAMLGEVDAVAFAVPPQVQADLAVRAARAGRHLLLEKPIATSVPDAARVAEAVEDAGVASVVFFTSRFQPELRDWIASVRSDGQWYGAWARWFASAFEPGSPYAESPWRREKGGLWDVGPHALSVLTAVLGNVTGVTADAGPRGVTYLVLHHEDGGSSTLALTLDAPRAATGAELTLWGSSGLSPMPSGRVPAEVACATAVRELVEAAASAAPSHPCDVRLGRHIVDVLAAAERQLPRS